MIEKIAKLLALILIAELCLGGGGRFTAIGPISLRMVLFGLALATSIILVIREKIIVPGLIWKLSLGFMLMIVVGIIVGCLNGSTFIDWFEDVKPLSYFFAFPFFYLSLEKLDIPKIEWLIKGSSVFMAIAFITIVVLINAKVIPFLSFYQATLKSGELFYRGEVVFFYKGFLLLGIGAIFHYFEETSKWRSILFSLLIFAIVLSVTRGLLLSLALTFSIYFLTIKSYRKAGFSFALGFIILFWGSSLILSGSKWFDAEQKNKTYAMANPNLLGDRNYSDNGRIAQAREVWGEASFSSALVGHGFGRGIPSRPVHMEIAYLEIFHKQGLLGLSFWAFFFGSIFFQYHQAIPSSSANAFFFSALFIFIESFTNQYINNPIGMSMLLLSWVSLYKLKG